jgi:MoxR-like ATPase
MEVQTLLESTTSEHYQLVNRLRRHLSHRVIGQNHLINSLLIALIADGHLLVEGAPGLAKTTAIKALSACIDASFHRIQFTPDLLPSDLTGTDIFRPQEGSFIFEPGPIFNHILLADEINRAPAKVQSALLEAMGERQVSIGKKTYSLPTLFLVMATQNPIEQEGTYALPEAQLDRFLLYVKIQYPHHESEKAILRLNQREYLESSSSLQNAFPKMNESIISEVRKEVARVHMSPVLENYLIELVLATREPQKYGQDIAKWLRYGASPRGTIALDRASRAHAWLEGRNYVTPKDIHAVIDAVLGHRIILSFEAKAEGVTPEDIIETLLKRVPIP